MQDLIAKAATLLEALPYIQKFSGATFVVKYGGLRMGMGLPVSQTWGFFEP
jgi:acetylglutamate kinase